MKQRIIALFLLAAMVVTMISCGIVSASAEGTTTDTADGSNSGNFTAFEDAEVSEDAEKADIEEALNLKNNADQTWTWSADADAWVLAIVSAVVNPEIPEEQGVSVCVPGAYVTGIDTDGDGTADVTASESSASEGVCGSLVIDETAEITSTNGQTYTASTAPVIINTGAAGYSSSTNTLAATTYAAEGYINVACGNRGKQDTVTDESGSTVYTGDAPCCLVDQKNAIRFVKYNILLGNLPGSVDLFIATGGSGGGAHATMVAATGNNPDYYDYEIEAGAVGVYKTEDGYSTSVTIDGEEVEISDGVWGCMAYSAITSLSEADMAMAFEYYLDTDYEFNTAFQKQMAAYLAEEYMEYINEQNLNVAEADVGFDLNEDGDTDDTVELNIEYDTEKYADTNGYGGTYLDLYLDEFEASLQSYLNRLDYAEGWTWFDADGNAMSDEAVAAMTTADKAAAFLEGRYAKASSGGNGPMGGGVPGNMGGAPADLGTPPDGNAPADMSGLPDGEAPADLGSAPDGAAGPSADSASIENVQVAENSTGDAMTVGTPDAGTTQASGSSRDSSNYATFEEMLASYESDIAEIEAGDEYGNNIVELYNPLNYIGADGTDNPTWVRILCGASEGDISMFNSLNLQIALLNAGTDCEIEWQWDGGHVPSEILGDSFSLYVDEMVAEYVDGAAEVTKPAAEAQTENGTATEATGTDLSGWVDSGDLSHVTFTLADAASYRTAGASKATPGFDVMDYGQEDYVFGSSTQDARHWDKYVLQALQEHEDVLSALWNAEE